MEVIPIDVVYEPIYHENVPVPCYFTSEIHLACRNYVGYFDKEKEQIKNRIVRQRHYSQNFFAKKQGANEKHLSICSAK